MQASSPDSGWVHQASCGQRQSRIGPSTPLPSPPSPSRCNWCLQEDSSCSSDHILVEHLPDNLQLVRGQPRLWPFALALLASWVLMHVASPPCAIKPHLSAKAHVTMIAGMLMSPVLASQHPCPSCRAGAGVRQPDGGGAGADRQPPYPRCRPRRPGRAAGRPPGGDSSGTLTSSWMGECRKSNMRQDDGLHRYRAVLVIVTLPSMRK